MSITAIAIKSNSRASSAKEVGMGMEIFRFMMNQLTMRSVQKTPIFHLNAAYTNNMANGDRQMTAKALKPELMNRKMASENKRKSNATLPPFSWVYSDSLFVYTFAIYFA